MKKIARKMKMKKKIFDRKQYECNDNSNLVSLNVNINVDNKNKFNIKDSELIKQDKLERNTKVIGNIISLVYIYLITSFRR